MKIRGVLGGLMALGAGQALAADWTWYPSVSASGVYNDNVQLSNTPASEISVSGAELDAELRMRAETPRSFFQLAPRLRSTFYPSESSQEADDQFVRLTSAFSTERTRASLDANWSHVTMLGSYFPSAVIGSGDVLGQPNPGEGVAQAGAQKNWQELAEITPTVSFKLSQRHSLELRLGYLDAGYDIQVPGDTVDYTDTYGRLSYALQLSQTARLSFRGVYSNYNPAAGESTGAYGLDAEWSNKISETSEYYLRAGAQRLEATATGGGGSSWDNGYTGGAGVRWAFEVSQIFVDLNHGLEPSSAGEYVTRDQLRAEWTRRITPLANVSLGARVIDESGGTKDSGFEDRTYAAGTIGFGWRFSRHWTLVSSYIYSWSEYQNANSDAQSNAVKVGIVWEPMRR